MLKCRFAGFDCAVQFARYQQTGNVAIQLVDAVDGSPIATASVNVPGVRVPDDQVAIKGWSENTGIETALQEAGVIEDAVSIIPTSFVAASVHPLTEKALEYASVAE